MEAILLIAILAVTCGADNGTEIEFFGLRKQAWRETFLDLPQGIPSHDAFGRVFGLLDPVQLEACFAAWVQSLASTLQDEIVAVDGKAARGVPPLHLVSIWAQAGRPERWVPAQGPVKLECDCPEAQPHLRLQ